MHHHMRGGLDFPAPSMACYDRPTHGGFCYDADQYMSMDGGVGSTQMNLQSPRAGPNDMDMETDCGSHPPQQFVVHAGQPNIPNGQQFGVPRKSVGQPTSCMPTAANSPDTNAFKKAPSGSGLSEEGSSDYDSCLGPDEVPTSVWAQATRGVIGIGNVGSVRPNSATNPIASTQFGNEHPTMQNQLRQMEMPQMNAVKRAGTEMYGIGEYTAKRQRFAPGFGPSAQQGTFMCDFR